MRKVLCVLLAMITCISLIISCSKSNSATNGNSSSDCTNTPKIFATDVNPIIQSFCNQPACHNAGSTNGPGPLTNYTQVFNARVDIRGAVATGVMPQNATLSTAQKNSILCWIDNGGQDN